MTAGQSHRVYLSLGSNVERHKHIGAALDALSKRFGELMLSRVFESEAVGFKGDNFFNLVVGFDSERSVGELALIMRAIEQDNGRLRDGVRFGPRTLDIDILSYDNCHGIIDGIELPRDEILKNAFVLIPLADIAGAQCHPLTGQSYLMHAQQHDVTAQKLWPIKFVWEGQDISEL